MATNWNGILSTTRNLNDVLVVLRKVLAELSVKADLTTIDEALIDIDGIKNDVTAELELLNKQINEAVQNGLMEPFATQDELLASRPTVEKYARAEDTKKIWWWGINKSKGEITPRWHDSGYSDLDLAESYIDERIAKTASNNIYPIIVDKNNNCPVWIENGELGFARMTEKSAAETKDQIGLGGVQATSLIPIVVDRNGNSPLWLEGGLVNFAAMHPDAIKKVIGELNQQSNNTTRAAYPILSDSTSLRQWKAKAANLKSGVEQQLRVVLTGDSWTEHNTISKELISLLRTEYGGAGGGWINLGAERNMLDDVQIEYSGVWVINDLNNINATFPFGCAPDGFTRTSTTTGASITLSNLEKGDVFTVFFGKTNGVFTYSLNGASEIEISTETEKLEINLTGKSSITFKVKSGEVCFFGFHMRKTVGSGIEFNRLGNGGATGQDFLKISPQSQTKFADFFSPDILIIILGTNDYRLGHSVENYKLGISAIIDGFRSSNPNCGVVLIAPSKSGSKATIELSKYRDAIYELSHEKQCEFYNMHDDWGEYQTERYELKQWVDSAHLSKSGAYRLSKTLFKNFLEI